ncbi:MAG: hypothetical protein RL199_1273 [Pseudomonadota bacterium]|jgi:hypothetical protein
MSRKLSLGVLALAAVLAGCSEDKVRRTLPPGMRVDTFAQVAVGKVDVLFVIDSSPSTEDKQANLARNFQGFFSYLQQAKVDYHIAVTTMDVDSVGPGRQGALFGTPAVITPETPKPLEAFSANATVGTEGSSLEKGLDAARRTLQLNPAGFLRPDASLYLVFVSDDEDHSEPAVPRQFYRYFESIKGKGNEGMISAGAIVGDLPDGCYTPAGGQARPANRYRELVGLVGGRTGSVCDSEFGATLNELGVDAAGLKRKWALGKAPDVASLVVTVTYPCTTSKATLDLVCSQQVAACSGSAGSVACTVRPKPETGPDGWTFEPSTNSVFFGGASLPSKGAVIEFTYYEEGQTPK